MQSAQSEEKNQRPMHSLPGYMAKAMLHYSVGQYRRVMNIPSEGALFLGRSGNPLPELPEDETNQERYRVFWEAGGWWIEDQSQTGTYFEDEPIQGRLRVGTGGRIRCGTAQVRLELLSAGTEPADGAVSTSGAATEQLERLRLLQEIARLEHVVRDRSEALERAAQQIRKYRQAESEWTIERRQIEELRSHWNETREQLVKVECRLQDTLAQHAEERNVLRQNLVQQDRVRRGLETDQQALQLEVEQLRRAHDGELRSSRDLRQVLQAQRDVTEHQVQECRELRLALGEAQEQLSYLRGEKQKVECHRDHLLLREGQLCALLQEARTQLSLLQQQQQSSLSQLGQAAALRRTGEPRANADQISSVRRRVAVVVTALQRLYRQPGLEVPHASELRARLSELLAVLPPAVAEGVTVGQSYASVPLVAQIYDRLRPFRLLSAGLLTTLDILRQRQAALTDSGDPQRSHAVRIALDNAQALAREFADQLGRSLQLLLPFVAQGTV